MSHHAGHSPNDDLHSLALQLSAVSQEYEKFHTDLKNLCAKYEGLPLRVRGIIGDDMLSDDMIAMLHNPTVASEVMLSHINRCRSVLLETAQQILRSKNF